MADLTSLGDAEHLNDGNPSKALTVGREVRGELIDTLNGLGGNDVDVGEAASEQRMIRMKDRRGRRRESHGVGEVAWVSGV